MGGRERERGREEGRLEDGKHKVRRGDIVKELEGRQAKEGWN